MNVKISEMPSATSLDGTELVPIVQSGVSKKASVNQLNEYSTTEQVIGTWIDGKPLYRKVGSIVFTSQTGNGAHAQGSLIDDHINYCAIDAIYATNCGISTNLYNGYNANYQNNIYIEATQNNVNYGHVMGYCNRASLLNMTIYVVVSYTKTTD